MVFGTTYEVAPPLHKIQISGHMGELLKMHEQHLRKKFGNGKDNVSGSTRAVRTPATTSVPTDARSYGIVYAVGQLDE